MRCCCTSKMAAITARASAVKRRIESRSMAHYDTLETKIKNEAGYEACYRLVSHTLGQARFSLGSCAQTVKAVSRRIACSQNSG